MQKPHPIRLKLTVTEGVLAEGVLTERLLIGGELTGGELIEGVLGMGGGDRASGSGLIFGVLAEAEVAAVDEVVDTARDRGGGGGGGMRSRAGFAGVLPFAFVALWLYSKMNWLPKGFGGTGGLVNGEFRADALRCSVC